MIQKHLDSGYPDPRCSTDDPDAEVRTMCSRCGLFLWPWEMAGLCPGGPPKKDRT